MKTEGITSNVQRSTFNVQRCGFWRGCGSRFVERWKLNVERWTLLFLFIVAAAATAQTTGLYTKPDPAAQGGLTAKVDQALSHAIALHRDHAQCYRAELSDGGKALRFTGMPTGKYDLILITRGGSVYEGVFLGDAAESVQGASRRNLDERIAKADTFFNKAHLHRFGVSDGGDKLWAFIERMRDKEILRQSGEKLNSNLRRFEVVEFTKSADTWTQVNSRHLYREEEPIGEGMAFSSHHFVPTLGNIRVIDSVKDLGSIALAR
jgi:hypothetical protein